VDQYELPRGKLLIIMGFAMQQPLLQPVVDKGSDNAAAAHVLSVYNQATRTAYKLSDWFRQQGWYAAGSRNPSAGALNLIPAALDSGLGELGKHGSLINRCFGSSFRLGYVVTDAPMVGTPADEFGADDFCVGCQVCR
jgi:epoxyqueuosine reductase QueG